MQFASLLDSTAALHFVNCLNLNAFQVEGRTSTFLREPFGALKSILDHFKQRKTYWEPAPFAKFRKADAHTRAYRQPPQTSPARRIRGALKKSALSCSSLPAASCLPFPAGKAPGFLPPPAPFSPLPLGGEAGGYREVRKGKGEGGGGGRSRRGQQGAERPAAGRGSAGRPAGAGAGTGTAAGTVPYPRPSLSAPFLTTRRGGRSLPGPGAATCPLRALFSGGEGAAGKGMREERGREGSRRPPLPHLPPSPPPPPRPAQPYPAPPPRTPRPPPGPA